jgi:hypothetical protein
MGQRSVDGALRSHAGCHFGAPIGLWSLLEDFAPEIPDFALDMHTMKGKELCRGLDLLRKEGAKLVPETTADRYEDEAYRLWATRSRASKPRMRKDQLDLRLRRVRLRLSRLAFAATFLRYCSTILSPEAPAIRLVPAFAAASIFSLTMRWASRWAALPPRINFAIRNPITRLLSNPSIIQFHMLRYS